MELLEEAQKGLHDRSRKHASNIYPVLSTKEKEKYSNKEVELKHFDCLYTLSGQMIKSLDELTEDINRQKLLHGNRVHIYVLGLSSNFIGINNAKKLQMLEDMRITYKSRGDINIQMQTQETQEQMTSTMEFWFKNQVIQWRDDRDSKQATLDGAPIGSKHSSKERQQRPSPSLILKKNSAHIYKNQSLVKKQ